MSNDDLVFIEKLKSGDEQAFNRLVELYSQKLYYLCLKILGNEQEAEDALQTVFLKVYTNIQKFEMRSGLSTWLYRISTNVCNDILRKKKNKFVVSLNQKNNDEEDFEISIPDQNENVEEKVLGDERNAALHDAIGKLKPKQKEFIVLRDLENLSYEEIAEILNLNIGTVKSGINRARESLLKILKENEELFRI